MIIPDFDETLDKVGYKKLYGLSSLRKALCSHEYDDFGYCEYCGNKRFVIDKKLRG